MAFCSWDKSNNSVFVDRPSHQIYQPAGQQSLMSVDLNLISPKPFYCSDVWEQFVIETKDQRQGWLTNFDCPFVGCYILWVLSRFIGVYNGVLCSVRCSLILIGESIKWLKACWLVRSNIPGCTQACLDTHFSYHRVSFLAWAKQLGAKY